VLETTPPAEQSASLRPQGDARRTLQAASFTSDDFKNVHALLSDTDYFIIYLPVYQLSSKCSIYACPQVLSDPT